MQQLFSTVAKFFRDKDGQDLLEYGLLVALIALVAIVGVTDLGRTINDMFWSQIGSQSF